MLKKFALLLVFVLVVTAVFPALAHEHRTTDDGLELTFGWWSEPAISGEPNGPEIQIVLVASDDMEMEATEEADGEHAEGVEEHHAESTPVEDAELQVEVTFGDQSRTVAMRPAWGQPGRYVADIMPMLPGDYRFRVFGTAGGFEIDETFDSADGGFSSVEPASDIQFPIAPPSNQELLELINDLQAQIDALRAGSAESSEAATEEAAAIADPTFGGLADRNWLLVAYGDALEPTIPADVDPSISIAFDAEGVSGTGGCNSFTGTFSYDNDQINFSPLAATRRACPDPVMEVEMLFFEALQSATSFTIEGDVLTITYGEGINALVFTAP